MSGGHCWHCGQALGPFDYGRADTCKNCGRDTKTCKACEFYDSSVHNECIETQAERVVDKERSNFCDYFKPSARNQDARAEARNQLKSAAEALFKKKG